MASTLLTRSRKFRSTRRGCVAGLCQSQPTNVVCFATVCLSTRNLMFRKNSSFLLTTTSTPKLPWSLTASVAAWLCLKLGNGTQSRSTRFLLILKRDLSLTLYCKLRITWVYMRNRAVSSSWLRTCGSASSKETLWESKLILWSFRRITGFTRPTATSKSILTRPTASRRSRQCQTTHKCHH